MAKQQSSSKSRAKSSRPARSSKKAAAKPSRGTTRGKEPRAAAGDEEVVIDRRRGARRDSERSKPAEKPASSLNLERRQKVNRRRQIDPTTCERDYTDQEVEFMNALNDYKRRSGRMFPTCSEVLEVIRLLGYVKVSPAEFASHESAFTVSSAKPMPSDGGQPLDLTNDFAAAPVYAGETEPVLN